MTRLHVILFLWFLEPNVQARFLSVSSTHRLYDVITKNPLTVVYFYEDAISDRIRKNTIHEYKEIMRAANRTIRFVEADMVFVTANVSKKNLSDARYRYHITTSDAILILNRGEPFSAGPLTDSITRQKLENYINDAAQNEINEILSDKIELRQQREKERYAGWYGVGVFPAAWGYPYGYGNYGGYGYGGYPSWSGSVNFSWGC